MNIAITGATGMIGQCAADYFERKNHTVTRFCRRPPDSGGDRKTVVWDALKGGTIEVGLTGQDCVIHLAGANIAAQKWTHEYKEMIYNSRIKGTEVLSQSLAQLTNRPKVLITASAVGFYGNHSPSEQLDESSPKGDDFLATVCDEWEKAAALARQAGIRVVHLRFGVVLSPKGGALAKMLTPFKLGLGGRLGDGTQMMSWVALDEIPRIIEFIIDHAEIEGAVNCVAPQAVSNADFTKVLGKVIKRPVVVPMPALAVKTLFGEMGETLLLGGQNVAPKRLTDAGYHFRYATLEQALQKAINNIEN